MYKYFPHTKEDISLMLEKIGLKDIEDLFQDIPQEALYKGDIDLPPAASEIQLRQKAFALGSRNKILTSFLGAGSYDVYTPSVIKALISRQEFLTSYTPYQPEMSQGTLQYIFEFQSIICELTKLDVSNASVYDGATATAEAMLMSSSHTRKEKILVSSTINPNIINVLKTYAKYRGLNIIMINEENGSFSKDDLTTKIDETTACVIVQNPNYYGIIEKYDDVIDKIKAHKALFVMNVDPSTLSVLKSPGEIGADIACGEAQTLGIPLSYGGPYLGFMATTTKLMRKLPGRIVGMTKDLEGKRGYVLTLQAREQHIRREKANSNICSNQSLMALHASIYVGIMGKTGMIEVAQKAYDNSHYLYEKLLQTNHFKEYYNRPFFKEFVVKTNLDIKKINKYLLKKGYLGGYNLGDGKYLLCASEVRTKEEIDEFVSMMEEVSHV